LFQNFLCVTIHDQADCTFSIHSLAEDETFHPVVGPVAEAQALYINQLKLRQRLQANAGEFVIWDVGLGAGGNVLAVFAATADLAEPGISTPASTGKGPTAIADARKGPSAPPYADLIDPGVPTPESLTAGNPSAVAPGQAVAELAEPNPNRTEAATAAVQPAGPKRLRLSPPRSRPETTRPASRSSGRR